MHQIRTQTLWNMLPTMIGMALGLVSVPLYYRFLGQEMYALWMYVTVLAGAFGFMDLGLGVAVGRYVGVSLGKGDHYQARTYWDTGQAVLVPILALMAILFATIGAILGPRWFQGGNTDASLLRLCYIAASFSMFSSYYFQSWNVLANAHLDFRFIGIIKSINLLGNLGGGLLAAWLTGNPLYVILFGTVFSILQLLLIIQRSRIHYGFGILAKQRSMFAFHEMKVFAAKIFASLFVGGFVGSLDRVILGKLMPPFTFNFYMISLNAGSKFQGISSAIMGPIFHNTTRSLGSISSIKPATIYDYAFRFAFDWLSIPTVWCLFWSSPAMKLWLGNDLATHISPTFPIFIVGFFMMAVSGLSTTQLGAIDRAGKVLAFMLANICVSIVLAYVGWTYYGLYGVALGFLFSRFVFIAQDFYLYNIIGAKGWASWMNLPVPLASLLLGCLFTYALTVNNSDYLRLIFMLMHIGIASIVCVLFHSKVLKH
jgi:O-antigen/teichoic acid export membrane protein